MFYLIYKITNTINNKIYIGSHKTKNKDDGYMGSGKYLNYAINKCGIENFTKEILFEFTTAKEMFDKEAELVNDKFLAEENTYNLKRGGSGGFDYINNNKLNGFTDIAIAKLGRASANKKLEEKYGPQWHTIISELGKEKSSATIKEKMQTDPIFRKNAKDRANNASKYAQTSSAKIKRKQTFKDIGHQEGIKNSQFGKMWITNGIENKSISKFDILPDGWRKGRILAQRKL